MAEIHIQPKKSTPSPWLLVVLAAVVLALAAYFFLRPDPVEVQTTAPDARAETVAPDSIEAPSGAAAALPAAAGQAATSDSASTAQTPAIAPVTASELAAYAATDAAAPGYARRGLQQLVATLVDLADRSDLQEPAIQEQRNNLTSATARIGEDPNASLRPGFVAAAGLMRAMQQKAYPEQEMPATRLVKLAGELSGRTASASDQQQVRLYFSEAAVLLQPLSQPATAQ